MNKKLAYEIFYLLEEESSIFFTGIIAKSFQVESFFWKITVVCIPEGFLQKLVWFSAQVYLLIHFLMH